MALRTGSNSAFPHVGNKGGTLRGTVDLKPGLKSKFVVSFGGAKFWEQQMGGVRSENPDPVVCNPGQPAHACHAFEVAVVGSRREKATRHQESSRRMSLPDRPIAEGGTTSEPDESIVQ